MLKLAMELGEAGGNASKYAEPAPAARCTMSTLFGSWTGDASVRRPQPPSAAAKKRRPPSTPASRMAAKLDAGRGDSAPKGFAAPAKVEKASPACNPAQPACSPTHLACRPTQPACHLACPAQAPLRSLFGEGEARGALSTNVYKATLGLSELYGTVRRHHTCTTACTTACTVRSACRGSWAGALPLTCTYTHATHTPR